MSGPPAYAVGHIVIKDRAKWEAYRRRVPETLRPWQGEVLMRGSAAFGLGIEAPYSDTVVIRFPDAAAVRGWHDSPAYQALIPLREQAADVVLVGYEG